MIQNKKILFVIDTLQIGGAEQSLLANTIKFRNINPIVCHLFIGDNLKQKFLDNGIKVYSLNIRRKYNFLESYKALESVVNTEKPDLIVGYITMAELICRLVGYKKKIPVLGTFITDLYASDYNEHLSFKSKISIKLFKSLNKLTCKTCVGFISNSQTIKEANSRHLNLPLERIKVINRGRDSQFIRRKGINNKEQSPVIRFLNVGRLIPVKGQIELINSFEKIIALHSNVTLHIIGDGPLRATLQNIIESRKLENYIKLLGSRNDVVEIICEYDCFVFPSHLEGFSGSVVESMFACVPVLASDIGANKEAIEHLNTGYLFEVGSTTAIQNAMIWFLNNRDIAEGCALNAYNFARLNFELEEIAKKFENYLIESAIPK